MYIALVAVSLNLRRRKTRSKLAERHRTCEAQSRYATNSAPAALYSLLYSWNPVLINVCGAYWDFLLSASRHVPLL